jgi:hypothetical protein
MINWWNLLLCLLLLIACNDSRNSKGESNNIAVNNSSDNNKVALIDSLENHLEINYHIYYLNDSLRKRLKKDFTSIQLSFVSAINRIDISKIYKVHSIVVPDTFLTDLKSYSPFPDSFPQINLIKKLILVSYPIQAFASYFNGKLQRWGPVNMGKKSTPTPIGLFHTNWKSKSQISTDNPKWILPWYFNLVNATGVSFHEFELPGLPVSHSCIRLKQEDAKWIFENSEQWKLHKNGMKIRSQGTPVIIFGEYAYDKPKPWYALTVDGHANNYTADSLFKYVNPFLEKIKTEQTERDSLKLN